MVKVEGVRAQVIESYFAKLCLMGGFERVKVS